MAEAVPEYRQPYLADIETPSYLYDGDAVRSAMTRLDAVRRAASCHVLFAMKSLSLPCALGDMVGAVDGFSVSSLFEAQLARSTIGANGSVHITTPGFRPDEIERIADLCDYIAFNSLEQLNRFARAAGERANVGLRVNPQLSLVDDARYDPCRPATKLGVAVSRLSELRNCDPESLKSVRGILIHSNCDATTLTPLALTISHLEARLGNWLAGLDWINLGGGYLFPEGADIRPFCEVVERLQRRYGLTVFIEPGAAIVRGAVSLVASVIDMFVSDGRMVAVLDTSVNHLPEVFEYQFEPAVAGHVDDGAYSYLIAGATCLAGDVFGEYTFRAPLDVGSRVVFPDVGAYSLVKAHMFNGQNLPSIYALDGERQPILVRNFTYEDFLGHAGAKRIETVRS